MFLRKVFIIFLLSVFSLTVCGYGVYKALPIILGPKIDVSSPQDGGIVTGTSIPVRGSVLRATSLYINSVPTAFTEAGNFETRIPIYPGSNIIIIEAVDRFGRTKTITENIGTN